MATLRTQDIALLLLVAGAVLLPGLGATRAIDGHEALVAQTAREMIERGDWMVPRFAGDVRLEKPPLAYWMVASLYQVFGNFDPAIPRLPSVAATALAALLVACFGAKARGRRFGVCAGLVHLTTFASVEWGRNAQVDATLALLVTACMLLNLRARRGPTDEAASESTHRHGDHAGGAPAGAGRREPSSGPPLGWQLVPADELATLCSDAPVAPGLTAADPPTPDGLPTDVKRASRRPLERISHWPHALSAALVRAADTRAGFAFWVLLGLATLAKGPVALLLVLPASAVIRLLPRPGDDRLEIRPIGSASWRSGLGIYVFLLLVVGWPNYVLAESPGALATWLGQSAGRFAFHYGPQTRGPFYYLLMAPMLLFPWSLVAGVTQWHRLSVLRRIHLLPAATVGLIKSWVVPSVGHARNPIVAQAAGAGARSWSTLEQLAAVWFGGTVLLLSLSAGKRDHYLLPALPAASLLLTHALLRGGAATRRGARLRRAAVAVAVGWLAVELGVRPTRDTRPEFSALVARQRRQLDAAGRVAQVGCHDRSSIFDVARPMTWVRRGEDGAAVVPTLRPGDLVLVTEEAWPAWQTVCDGEVLDRMGPSASSLERRPDHRYLLVKPRLRPSAEAMLSSRLEGQGLR